MSILLTAAVLFAQNANSTQPQCRVTVRNKVQTQEVLDDKRLVELALSLKARASQINPVSDHIPELVLPVQQVANQIRLALLEKTHEKLYLTRKPMLEAVIREIEDRIASHTVTYQFSAVLPTRVGWLLKMSEKDPNQMLKDPRYNQPIPEIETSHFYFARTYQTHQNFIAALEKVDEFIPGKHRGISNRPPVMKTMYDNLRAFPERMFIPAFHSLNIPELNQLMEMKVFPIGNIRSAIGRSKLDGVFFDEMSFPSHDWSHAIGIEENPRTGTLTEKIVGPLETLSLKNVRRSNGNRAKLWNIFHFILFHEGLRYDYTDLSVNGLKDHYRDDLEGTLKGIFKREAQTEIFETWFLTRSKKQQEEELKVEGDLFLQMLAEKIESNRSEIQSELNRIKHLSGQ